MGYERRVREQPPPPTVLVVDDSTTVRAILRRVLQAEGLRVIEAANGREALTYAVIERPDLVLLDIDMPVMDGLETLEALQRDDTLSDCPVLMLTAHTGGTEVAAALDRGARDYLRKPCEPVELTARVRRALNLQRDQNVLRRRAEELGEISTHDPLTGLANRRLLTQWLAERSDAGLEIAAFMVDIDRFKQVNDREGHLVGDRVLIQLAARLRRLASADRLVVRWGGEEFLLTVPMPADESLDRVARSICALVKDDPFEIGGGRELALTVSIGVAAGPAGDLGGLLARADGALYAAKEAGRDRYVVAG